MIGFRKSKSFGPFRLTLSKRGLSTSVGVRGFRISRSAGGRIRRTISVPGTGIYDTKVIGGGRRKSRQPPATTRPLLERVEIADDSTTPPATVWQRNYVKSKLLGRAPRMPDLKDVTVGQCEEILRRIGEDPRALYRWGRAWGQKKVT